MKKVVVLNASPRKNFNTAQALIEAKRGAEDAGAETEYFNLYDFNYKGCLSCFTCKLKNNSTHGMCVLNDDLKPILKKILESDATIIGSPIYWSYPTGMFRNLLERLLFAAGTYLRDEKTFFKRQVERKINFGLIYTMNVDESAYKQFNYSDILAPNENYIRMMFGHCETMNIYDTYQFTDYSKYDCDIFDEKHKADIRELQFPHDLKKAYDLGKRLTESN